MYHIGDASDDAGVGEKVLAESLAGLVSGFQGLQTFRYSGRRC
jgi:hypothetical protein